eukprot:TRINITY_DN3522_c0_g1_i1.p1 TRINITY_DN3522_c0_g1~~TRINITY_DN3522_c0_g1_i1.p1  ORF type:complete len:379 (+),score=76.30 TRINITY_DN3522_c0_g1_i1:554-1690(+)
MPDFLWVLRDFALDLEDDEGNSITSQQYLERSLKERPGFTAKNNIRQAIKKFFVRRDCITLVRPTTAERDLKAVDTIPEERLRPEFLSRVNELTNKVLSAVGPKIVMGRRLSGEGFLNLVRNYVDAINTDVVPNIENTWEILAKQENMRYYERSVEFYLKEMEKAFELKPLEEDVLLVLHEEKREETLKSFLNSAMGDHRSALEQLGKNLHKLFSNLHKENTESSITFCTDLFQRLFSQHVHSKLSGSCGFPNIEALFEAWELVGKQWKEESRGIGREKVFCSLYPPKVQQSTLEYYRYLSQIHKEQLDASRDTIVSLQEMLQKEKASFIEGKQQALEQKMLLTRNYEDKLNKSKKKKKKKKKKYSALIPLLMPFLLL